MPRKSSSSASQEALNQRIRELEQEVAAYQQILDYVPLAVIYKGPESKMFFANQRMRDVFSITPADSPDHPGGVLDSDRQVFETGQPLEQIRRPHSSAGHEFHIKTVTSPVRGADGAVIGTVGISAGPDYSEATRALEAAQARMSRLIANIPGMVFQARTAADGAQAFTYVSEGVTPLFGITRAEALADPLRITNAILPDDLASYQESSAAAASALAPWIWEGRANTPDGIKWIHCAAQPAQQPDDSLLWDGVYMDVTDAHNALATTADWQRRYDLVVASSNQLVYDYDIPRGTISWSGNIKNILGLEPDALNGAVELWSSRIHPDDSPHALELFEQAKQSGRAYEVEYRYRHNNGNYLWMYDHGLFITDDRGQTTRMLGMMQDITTRKQNESERERLQNQIIQAQANALRELSTPLIPLSQGVVIMPLIGSIDSQRSMQIIDSLLHGVADQQARIAILDLTGVPVVDTQVASAIIQAAQSVRLLGAEVVITGIRPEIAQTLVGLGVSLEGVITRGNLQSGIEHALQRIR